ncbi:hypothetical protein MNBD_GAMMA06-413 [hydrothermal vent metagenome]|uniref:Uncharacterized protein n=1 Tax=hydrothermal vent metagenome TaxID=652676 RepID=A0A3B0W4J3_9ZZZZ
MKTYRQLFFILISFSVTSQAVAINKPHNNAILKSEQKIIKIHNAIRSASLRIQLGDNLYGFIESKNCSFCKTIKITVTPNTKAYRNNISVPLKQAKKRSGQFATIIYNLKTNNVSAIHW